jgi:D-alanine-D-alanine ligase-like ATP-grasp enzyme
MANTQKKTGVIGASEQISLPEFGVENIPAKVDTGADSSSIWASDVQETDDGKLSFCLFAPGSRFYRGQKIAAEEYKITSVKNSFGQKEFRYSAKLKVKLSKRTMTCWFSLADRSQNTYPVLLGRNFLRNRYLVNTGQKNLHKNAAEMPRVCVLSNSGAANVEFLASLPSAAEGLVQYQAVSYDELWFRMSPRDIRVTVGGPEGEDVSQFDLVYIKTHEKSPERAMAAVEYLRYSSARFTGKEIENNAVHGKLSEGMRLLAAGVRVPDIISAGTQLLKDNFSTIKVAFGLPFVLKESSSNRGKNNYLIHKKAEFDRIMADAPEEQIFLAQRYVHNDGFLRIVVMGGRVALAIKRHRYPSDDEPLKAHLNNRPYISQAELVGPKHLPAEAKRLAIHAATVLKREVAGVDLVQDETSGKWYVLEANNSPQLRVGPYKADRVKAFDYFINRELVR